MADIVKLTIKDETCYPLSIPEAVIDPEDNKPISEVLPNIKDKKYDSTKYSGMGRKYLKKNMINGINVLEQDMISETNTIYIIQYDYDLQGEIITIPENCILDFQGGSFSSGLINFNRATISGIPKIYCNYTGDITNNEVYCKWFGFVNDNITDEIEKLQQFYDNFKHKLLDFNGYTIITSAPFIIQEASIRNLSIYNISEDVSSSAVYVYDDTQPAGYRVPNVNINGLNIRSKNNIAYGLNLNDIRYSNFSNINISNVQTCIYTGTIFISSFKELTLTNYTECGLSLSNNKSATSVTVENFYSVGGSGYAIKAIDLDYSIFTKIACDSHKNGCYFYFETCSGVSIDTVGNEFSTFNDIIRCINSQITFKNLFILTPTIVVKNDKYSTIVSAINSQVNIETIEVVTPTIVNEYGNNVYGYRAEEGGEIILINAKGGAKIVTSDGSILSNGPIKILDNKPLSGDFTAIHTESADGNYTKTSKNNAAIALANAFYGDRFRSAIINTIINPSLSIRFIVNKWSLFSIYDTSYTDSSGLYMMNGNKIVPIHPSKAVTDGTFSLTFSNLNSETGEVIVTNNGEYQCNFYYCVYL